MSVPTVKTSVVVDACVGRSAGSKPYGMGYVCASVLNAIDQAGLDITMSPELEDEWLRNGRQFGIAWLYRMQTHRRIRRLTRPQCSGWATCALCPNLTAAITSLKPPTRRAEIEKDRHLIEAAYWGDKRVVSCDAVARRAFCGFCKTWNGFTAIYWAQVGDSVHGTTAIQWLTNGAPHDAAMALDNKDRRRR